MIPASPETVFDLLVDPALNSRFTGEPAAGGCEIGETMTSRNGRIVVRHLELQRGRRIVQEWSTAEWPSDLPPSRLEIEMRSFGQGTDLRLVQSGVPSELLDEIEQWWYELYWDPMFEHLRSRALY
jgi:uncharacterized protein YndB with AHSA1/START domain